MQEIIGQEAHRLELSPSSAEEDGWSNVSNYTFAPKDLSERVSKPMIPVMRSLLSRKSVFSFLFPYSLSEHIANCTQNNIPVKQLKSPLKSHPRPIGVADVEAFLGMLLAMCIGDYPRQRDFIRNTKHGGLTHHQFERVKKHLSFHEETMFSLLNQAFKEHWQAGKVSVLQECLWPWSGDHPGVIFIPQKVNSSGFKVHCLCVKSTQTQRPYCFHFLPDLYANGEPLSPETVLNNVKSTALEYMPGSTLVMGMWYTLFDWVEFNKDFPVVGSLKTNQVPYIDLFSYNLKHKEFRTFTNGNVILTVFADDEVVRTVTNSFHIVSPKETDLVQLSIPSSIPFSPTRLSEDALINLQQWSLRDLKSLAHAIGESTEGTTRDLAYRISGHQQPIVSSSLLTSQEDETIVDSGQDLEAVSAVTKESPFVLSTEPLERAGIKRKSMDRSIRKEKKRHLGDSSISSVLKFLDPTGHVQSNDDVPEIIQFYRQSIETMEKFRKLHIEIQYKFRCGSAKLCWLINCLLIAVVNSWVIWLDLHEEEAMEDDSEMLKAFVKQLSDELMSSCHQTESLKDPTTNIAL